jgi:hypothetical protein
VAISHLAGDESLTGSITRALGPLAAAGHPIEVEPWQGSPRLAPDARIARRIVTSLEPSACLLTPPGDLAEAVDRMTARAVVLAPRFHAAVAAAMARVPFVAIAHEPKLAAIARRTEQLAVSPHASGDLIAESLRRGILGPPVALSALEGERRRARATLDLLGLLLEGGGQAVGLEHLDLVPEPTPA